MHEGQAHRVARLNRRRLAERLEDLLSANELAKLVVDGEVGGEHTGRDFAAVCAVADKHTDQTGAFGRLRWRAGVSATGAGGSNKSISRMRTGPSRRSTLLWLRCPWTIRPGRRRREEDKAWRCRRGGETWGAKSG